MAHPNAQAAPLDPARRPRVEALDPRGVIRHLCHELRQPLSTIESAAYFLQLLEKQPPSGEHIHLIQNMVRQANGMLSDALYLLHPPPPRPQRIHLAELVRTALQALEADESATLHWQEPNDAPFVWMDPAQAAHLVRSLLSAFAAFAQPAEGMQLSLSEEGRFAVLACSAPAPEAVCQNCHTLFEPLSPLVPGAGLAFAAIQRIATTHDGGAAASAADGVLTIELRLPAAPALPTAQSSR